MYKVYLTVISVLISFVSLNAQQQGPNIAFSKTVHDYGKIKEEDGVAKYKFELTNTGSAPLVIQKVSPSCGCTSSNFTKSPIKPGEKGFVSAEYNAANRPGPFNKTIRVYSNSKENNNIVLRIKGDVIAKPRTIEDDYPKQMDGIRLDNTQFAFMNITNRQEKTKILKVINVSEKPITLSLDRTPKYLKVEFRPTTLKAGEKGTIEATFMGEKVKDYGYVRDRMTLKINDNAGPHNKISSTAIVKEDFSHLTPEERANAPQIKFEETTFDFETITEGEKITHEYVFKNTGKSELIIRKVHANCGCTAAAPPKTTIKPGESSNIKVTFNSRGKINKQHKTVRIYSNSPDNSIVTLVIKGSVKKKLQ